ncbi:hypothetical protein CK203_113224 [Vitis vinifera]|uniref:GAG-pre-integrase domain-containing protein n=1 Tax=Vitis vinifera TaxID=29760 RepID=A0A438DPU8_VITVI|nr:hypothetical protein CK203_113224 [Vitis vinifera]
MTPDLSHLDQASNYTGKGRVVVENDASLPITHTGTISPIPSLELLDNRQMERVVATDIRDDGLYVLERGNSAFISVLKNKALHASYDLWHVHLGHVSHSIISLLNKNGHLCLTSLLSSPSLCDTLTPSALQLTSSTVCPHRFSEVPDSLTGPSSSSLEPRPPHVASDVAPTPTSLLVSHPMLTRAKAGIFKTRHPANLSILHSSGLLSALLASTKPKGFKFVAKNPT